MQAEIHFSYSPTPVLKTFLYCNKSMDFCSKRDACGLVVFLPEGHKTYVHIPDIVNWNFLPDTTRINKNWPEFGHYNGDIGFENVDVDVIEFEDHYDVYTFDGEIVKKYK